MLLFLLGGTDGFPLQGNEQYFAHVQANFYQRLLDSSAPKGLNTLVQETLERSNVFVLGIDVSRHGL